MKFLTATAVLFALGLSSVHAGTTTVFESVGKKGEKRYSQLQPNDTKNFKVIEIRSDGRQASAGQMAQIPDKTQPDPNAEAQRIAELEKQVQEQKANELARTCQTLRNNLASLSTGGRIYENNAQGQKVFLNDQEISARRQKTLDAINSTCTGK